MKRGAPAAFISGKPLLSPLLVPLFQLMA